MRQLPSVSASVVPSRQVVDVDRPLCPSPPPLRVGPTRRINWVVSTKPTNRTEAREQKLEQNISAWLDPEPLETVRRLWTKVGLGKCQLGVSPPLPCE